MAVQIKVNEDKDIPAQGLLLSVPINVATMFYTLLMRYVMMMINLTIKDVLLIAFQYCQCTIVHLILEKHQFADVYVDLVVYQIKFQKTIVMLETKEISDVMKIVK